MTARGHGRRDGGREPRGTRAAERIRRERLLRLGERWRERVAVATDWLAGRGFGGRVGLILGSGLGNVVEAVERPTAVSYGDIPGYTSTSVAEHAGRLVTGTAAGVPVIVMQGRLHPYEGLPWDELLLPTAVLACLGIDVAVVTNAAGGLNRFYAPGDLMIIRDQLDLHLTDPLRGLLAPSAAPAARPPSASAPPADRGPHPAPLYDQQLARLLAEAAAGVGVTVHAGTYASVWWPTY
jgi:purine-nucleoside phosphorylase